MNIPSPRTRAPKEDVISSTETSNCFANSTYPALATGDSTPARLVAKILHSAREEVVLWVNNDRHEPHEVPVSTYRDQKHASFFHLGQFNLARHPRV